MTLDEILTATLFTDLFKEGTKKELRALLKEAHPDLHPNDKTKAETAFIHVNKIWKLKDTPNVNVKEADDQPKSNTIVTKKHEYTVRKQTRQNGGVNHYAVVNETGQANTLLIASHPKTSTMLLDGVRNLKQIKTTIPEEYKEFFPETQDAFHINQNGNKLSGVAQTSTYGYYTLTEVKEDYPEGIPARDVAWMYRRMLVAVGNAHDAGYAHAAPDADAFLIHPETHALVLTNWQYSQTMGNNILMLNPNIKPFYDDKKTSVKKDLQILSQTALNLLNDKAPKRMRLFLKGMKQAPTATAAEGLKEFDLLLKDLYGPRQFHEFKMRRPKE